jgi:hypothetical protein
VENSNLLLPEEEFHSVQIFPVGAAKSAALLIQHRSRRELGPCLGQSLLDGFRSAKTSSLFRSEIRQSRIERHCVLVDGMDDHSPAA